MIKKFLDLGYQLLVNKYLKSYKKLLNNVDYVYLGAWNFKDVIANKEREFVENGGKFITHVPEVMVFS